MATAQPIATYRQTTLMSSETNESSRKRLWTGRVLTGLSGAFLIFDACTKLVKPPAVVRGAMHLGYPESTLVGIGVVLFACTLLYLIPRTSVLGAVLLTGYLGGAVATNVRAEMGAFNILAPAIFACIAWGGLWLRETRLSQLLPLKHKA
jgi:DoxX-like family